MKDLLDSYSIDQIISFLITFSIALKATLSFWDWTVDRLKRVFKGQTDKERQNEMVKSEIADIKNQIILQKRNMDELTEKINILIDSDKDDIKAYITDKHHVYTTLGWIDYQTLAALESRYGHYKKENGNSFVEDLMIELKSLPKKSVEEKGEN